MTDCQSLILTPPCSEIHHPTFSYLWSADIESSPSIAELELPPCPTTLNIMPLAMGRLIQTIPIELQPQLLLNSSNLESNPHTDSSSHITELLSNNTVPLSSSMELLSNMVVIRHQLPVNMASQHLRASNSHQRQGHKILLRRWEG